jgi:hypothetical protein
MCRLIAKAEEEARKETNREVKKKEQRKIRNQRQKIKKK